MKKIILKTLIVFYTTLNCVYAQSDFVVAGGRASGTGGNISYSIGQTNYSSGIASSGSVSEGVQQPYEIYVTKGKNINWIQLDMSVFPNPTTDYIILRIDQGVIDNLFCEVYDGLGKLLRRINILDKETEISLQNYNSSTYNIMVLKNNLEIKSFKIISIK